MPLDLRVPKRGRGGLVASGSPCTEEDEEEDEEWYAESVVVGRNVALATSGSATLGMDDVGDAILGAPFGTSRSFS